MIAATVLCLQLVNSATPDLDAYQRRVTPEVRVVQKVAPTVVFITTEGVARGFDIWGRTMDYKTTGSGSGVVIHEEGYIVTNYHVVQSASLDGIRVTFDPAYGDETIYQAQLISAEPTEDLALLKIEGERPFQPIEMGTSSDLMIAERVLAIGNPYGQTHTVSQGIISGLHRQVDVSATLRFDELIQTDAAINPGNSGGPLVNINGELIGINTVMNKQAQNIGFAIPVDAIREVLQEKLLSPSMARAWIGFDVDFETLAVQEVLRGSPADTAGMRPGDRVVRIEDEPVANEEQYRFARLELPAGRTVSIEVERDGERFALELETWNRVRGLLFKRLGVQVEDFEVFSRYRRYSFLKVVDVRPEGPADLLGVQPGDVLTTVVPEGRRSTSVLQKSDLALLVNGLDRDATLHVELWRDLNKDGIFQRGDEYSELFQGPLVLE